VATVNLRKGLLLGTAILASALISVASWPSEARDNSPAKHMVPPGYDCRNCGAPYGVPAPIPPTHFDPVAASDEELAFFGFPPRPDASNNPQEYAEWKKVVTLPVRRIQAQMRLTNIKHGPARDVSVLQQPVTPGVQGATSTNWGGYAIDDPKNPFKQTKTYIYGVWVVPFPTQAVGTCNGTWNYSSPWVGFDGWGSGDVLQAGMDIDAYCSGSTKSQYYAAWYEWYPAGSVYFGNFPVAAGDVIYVYVWPTSTTVGNYYMVNLTQQVSSGGSFNAPSGTTLVGNSAEWITEWFDGPMVTNYWDIPWYYATGSFPSGSQFSPVKAPSGSSIYSITLEDSKGDQLSNTFSTPNNKLIYTNPSGDDYYYSGSTLWFQTVGIAQ
jgi:hypothetical protein